MSLFDLVNLRAIDKFKDKDLLGPLKYLKESADEEAVEKKNAYQISKPEAPTSTAVDDAKSVTAKRFDHESKLQLQGLTLYSDHLEKKFHVKIDRKPYLRHLRFYVKPNGTVRVVAPQNRKEEMIFKELKDHLPWIEKCDHQFSKLRQKFPKKIFTSGQKFPFLGEEFILNIKASDFKKPFIQFDLDQLQFFYPEKWDHLKRTEKRQLLKKALSKFYYEKAVLHLNRRVRILSEQVKLYPKKITFRNQKTRWGSCSPDTSISLNWKLITFGERTIDYVIIHELCHIKHPNHSQRFWTLVQSHCIDFKRIDKSLNKLQYAADFLAPESELYLFNPSLV